MSFDIKLEGGVPKRLPTAGKYCDRDIIVSPENLDEKLAQQDTLIERIKTALQGKSAGGGTVEAKLQEKDITENGVYTPDEGFDGFSKVTVNVSASGEKPTLFAPSISIQSVTSELTISDDRNGAFEVSYDVYAGDNKLTTLSSKTAMLNDYIEHTETIEIKVQALGANFNPSDYAVTTWEYVNAEGTPGLAYTISGSYATCIGIGDAVDTDIEIATEYEGVPVTRIGNAAFQNCINLTSVDIPDSVTTIGDKIFQGCSNLARVKLPSTITQIVGGMFSGCSNLTSVDIPDSVTKIYSSAFYACQALPNITIPDGVTMIADYAFYGCRSLTSVVIPNLVSTIYLYAFYNCSNLTSVVIGSSVTTIDQCAFDSCNLTSVEIPSSVKEIRSAAFMYNRNLTRLDFSNHTSVPTLSNKNAFSYTAGTLQIKVPASLIDSWKTATNWSNYASKIVTRFSDEPFTFTIDGTTYQAEEGMTWGEWVTSEYNPGNFYMTTIRGYNGCVTNGEESTNAAGNLVLKSLHLYGKHIYGLQTAPIVENAAYTMAAPQHSGGSN